MEYIVSVQTRKRRPFAYMYMRGTVWTADKERAERFECTHDALNASVAAKKNLLPEYRGRVIVEPYVKVA